MSCSEWHGFALWSSGFFVSGRLRTDVLHDLSRHARMGEMLTECCDQTQNGPHVLASSATSRAA